MITNIKIGGLDATVRFDPDIQMYRGEVQFTKCAADFYGRTVDELRIEGEISVRVLREFAIEKGLSLSN